MAVEKSFVVKNGLEVNKSLLLANEQLQKVGILTDSPAYTLDVSGGIGATDVYVGSAATVSETFVVGSNDNSLVYADAGIGSVGIGTNDPKYLLDINGPVSTGTTALFVHGDAFVTGTINVGTGSTNGSDIIIDGNVEVIGISTFDGHVDIDNTLNVIGLSTFNNVSINTSLYVAGITSLTELNVSGITSLNTLYVGGASTFVGVTSFMDNVYVDGDLTVGGNLYGDGSTLSGIVTQLVAGSGVVLTPSSGTGSVLVDVIGTDFLGNIGVSSGNPDGPDTFIGVGVTNLVFQSTSGSGVTVSDVVGGASTVSITPGISIGLAIALGGK